MRSKQKDKDKLVNINDQQRNNSRPLHLEGVVNTAPTDN